MSETISFEVEGALEISGRGVVLARSLGDPNFPFTVEATLGGCRVSGFDIPRALRPDGHQRQDLFAFFLDHREDLAKFSKGQRVELIA